VFRGGSWLNGAQFLRSASRNGNDPSGSVDIGMGSFGFRIVRP
jgi:formylglycine-generating enzyme required for sulfatase activity